MANRVSSKLSSKVSKTSEESETEILEIDEDSECLAYFLTLMLVDMAPEFDRGETYSYLLEIILRNINGDLKVNEAVKYSQKICRTAVEKPRGKH